MLAPLLLLLLLVVRTTNGAPQPPLLPTCEQPPPTRDRSLSATAQFDDGNMRVVYVTRAAIEWMLNDSRRLATSARVVPSIRDGRPNGVKLYAVRPYGPLWLLG